jgi:FixJ family two-component response regulator
MLTDVVMPGMGGRPLAERLQVTRPDLRVLFMSGHTEDAILRHGVREALYSFIQKPFSMDVLLRTVRGVLDDR